MPNYSNPGSNEIKDFIYPAELGGRMAGPTPRATGRGGGATLLAATQLHALTGSTSQLQPVTV